MRQFVQTYFDDIFVHSRASEGKTAVEVHLGHLREVLLCMRENRIYANINKCNFGAEEIPFLGCFLGKDGVRADPEKVCAIAQWPMPVSQKDLRKWLGLSNYLHKYSANYAEMARPLTNLLKKDAVWSWTSEAQRAFKAIKSSLQSAPTLALPDEERPFSVVCDASDFAIGCALLQVDAEGREWVVSFQSRQLKAAEKNYPVHDKELLAMKYALVKFRVHLLGQKPFVINNGPCLVEDGDVVASPLSAHGAVALLLRRIHLHGGVQTGKAECPSGCALPAARLRVGASGLPRVSAL
ncbi:hypothetical protein PF010_g29572 [Phytophthora fragariae]|uniref:Reverse transcriptase/retrotransposon-derived protein RNase H-like domain-containing protein n=1 Tax=Phytophthora fragariae TaxID=53985 RepID=A0A6A4B5Z9_9STRA|nr:hypothetical protein PF010_g29572 [Phytophthora fragariae]KAE9265921.1 hypothetical protein PF001_g30690 [Phytophthora fragariae]